MPLTPFLLFAACREAGGAAGECSTGEAGDAGEAGPAYDPAELTKGAPSRHLWLGNLHQRLPRSLLRSTFERFGPVEDVVTFPGRMYAFVNFREAADAAKAAQAVQVRGAPCVDGLRGGAATPRELMQPHVASSITVLQMEQLLPVRDAPICSHAWSAPAQWCPPPPPSTCSCPGALAF